MIRHSVHTSQLIHVLKKWKLNWHILRTVEERANFLDDAHESTLCWSGGVFKRVFFFKKTPDHVDMSTTFECPDKEESRWLMFDKTVVMKDQRSQSVFLSQPLSHLRGISVWERAYFMRVSVSLKILNKSVDFYKLLLNTMHVKSKGTTSSSSSWWNWPFIRRWHWCISLEWWRPRRMTGWSWPTTRRWTCSVCSCWHSRCVS